MAPLLAPHDPKEQDLLYTLLPPAWTAGGEQAYPLGTDSLGRCILSRLIYGSRIALFVAVVSATGAMVLGTSLALIAGYFGRRIDWVIGRAVDIWMAFPPVVLALILLVGSGPASTRSSWRSSSSIGPGSAASSGARFSS